MGEEYDYKCPVIWCLKPSWPGLLPGFICLSVGRSSSDVSGALRVEASSWVMGGGGSVCVEKVEDHFNVWIEFLKLSCYVWGRAM